MSRRSLSIRVETRVTRSDLADLLCHAHMKDLAGFDADDWTPETRPPGRERILNAARESVRHYGVEAYGYWRDDADDALGDHDADDLHEWAVRAVARAFPELVGR